MSDPTNIKIHVVNNEGAGFAKDVEVVAGSTVEQYVKLAVTAEPNRYRIHVNGQPATSSQVLRSGDRMVITPMKVAGATFRKVSR